MFLGEITRRSCVQVIRNLPKKGKFMNAKLVIFSILTCADAEVKNVNKNNNNQTLKFVIFIDSDLVLTFYTKRIEN